MRYFIADTHFGAREQLIRGMLRCYPGTNVLFPDTSSHDNFLIKSINSCVNPNDELFILGDFAADRPGKYRQKIKCKNVKFVRGNHDRYEHSKKVFGEAPWMRTTRLINRDGRKMYVVLSHFPMVYWMGSHRGWAHLYGHTHSQREATLNGAFKGRRSMDVGVDNLWLQFGTYCPVSEVTLFQLFDKLPGHDNQDYYRRLQDERDVAAGYDPATRSENQR